MNIKKCAKPENEFLFLIMQLSRFVLDKLRNLN